jgi:hypothetical protein
MAVLPWLVHPSHDSWICWKESEHNSASRRFWTVELAQFFGQNYRIGDGILFAEGDVPGVFCRARVPLSETLNQGDGPAYLVNAYQPRLVRNCKWAVVLMGERDPLSRTIGAANPKELGYESVLEVQTKYDPVVRVYRRRW